MNVGIDRVNSWWRQMKRIRTTRQFRYSLTDQHICQLSILPNPISEDRHFFHLFLTKISGQPPIGQKRTPLFWFCVIMLRLKVKVLSNFLQIC